MRNVLCCLFMFLSLSVWAQFDNEPVFVDLDGEDLRVALILEYKTFEVLDYGDARDTLFKNIDAVDNVLKCVYTGYKINLDPNLDPTQNAFDQGINTEHTYPRSKGATEGTLAFSDMHHLFPTRAVANNDRGSLPFSEILDFQTDKWYFEENVTTTIPGEGIQFYSELLTNVFFEPREDHKGDVARAYFYFYTMYSDQAENSEPGYFNFQRETMCQWHFQDPVDEKEWIRNEKIAIYQDDKKNPFILDCRLARLYCDEVMGSCLTVSTQDELASEIIVRPNPVHERLFIEMDYPDAEKYVIFSNDGRISSKGWIDQTEKDISISTQDLQKGFYIIQIFNHDGHVIGVSKFIKI